MGFAYDKHNMFFVGGNDSKANNAAAGTDSQAGGCTKDWWITEVGNSDRETALGLLMQANGDAIQEEVGTATYSDLGPAGTAITMPGGTSGIEVGMLAYCTDVDGNLDDGEGIYEITAVSGIAITINSVFGVNPTFGNDSVWVGGAWSTLDNLAQEITAATNNQEIHINKDFAPAATHDCSTWGYGDTDNNSFLRIIGFSRLPGDITTPGDTFFESVLTADIAVEAAGSLDATKWVHVNQGTSIPTSQLFDADGTENLTFEGFYIFGATGGAGNSFAADATTRGLIVRHCAVSSAAKIFSIASIRDCLIIDCYSKSSASNMIQADTVTGLWVINSIMRSGGFQVSAFSGTGGVIGSYFEGDSVAFGFYGDSDILVMNSTGKSTSTGIFVLRGGGSVAAPTFITSLNNILLGPAVDTDAYGMFNGAGNGYGSFYTSNDNAYIPSVGVMTAPVYDFPIITGNGIIENLVEEDPLLDANNEPLTVNVRRGGMRDLQNDTTSIGAIEAMNTAQIEASVNAALVTNNLDHLMKVAVADRTDMTAEVVDDTVLANIMTKTDGDTSDYTNTTDSLEALRDNLQVAAAAALTAYDPPTRTEATSDKAEIIVEVDANETKIDALPTAALIANAVLLELIADHSGTSGSLAEFIELIKDIAEADTVINTSDATQWKVIFNKKGTSTEIMRKNMKDINGAAITATSAVLGAHEHTTP